MTTRTAELCSEQGNIDLLELMVIVDMVQCQVLHRYNAKGKSFLHVDQFCKKKADKTKTPTDTTALVMIR